MSKGGVIAIVIGLLAVVGLAWYSFGDRIVQALRPEPVVVPVVGALKWEDGTAVAGATIRFVPTDSPAGVEAVGTSDEAGQFRLTFLRGGDGAYPGDYVVVVTKHNTPKENKPPITPGMKDEEAARVAKEFSEKTLAEIRNVKEPVPDRYGEAATSPLRATVTARGGGETVELVIQRR